MSDVEVEVCTGSQSLFSYNMGTLDQYLNPMNTEENSTLFDMLIAKTKGAPFLFYYANLGIAEIQNYVHMEDELPRLRESGIHVFLFEPICSYWEKNENGMPILNRGFYSEIPNDVPPEQWRCPEFDTIHSYAKINDIKVTVHTCDANSDRYVHYLDYLTFVFDDMFLQTLPYIGHFVFEDKPIPSKKFMCLAWRYTASRFAMCNYLMSIAPDDTNMTWGFQVDYSVPDQIFWLDPNSTVSKRIRHGMPTVNANGPYSLDLELKRQMPINDAMSHYYPSSVDYAMHENPASDNPHRKTLNDYYTNTFCDVVMESRFAQPTANYSEKLYQAILHCTPFVVVAPPGTLRELRKEGFKTFSQWWDESYDDEENHTKRFEMICEVLDYINSKTYEELHAMQQEMEEVHKYNLSVYSHPDTRFAVLDEELFTSGPDQKKAWARDIAGDYGYDTTLGY